MYRLAEGNLFETIVAIMDVIDKQGGHEVNVEYLYDSYKSGAEAYMTVQ